MTETGLSKRQQQILEFIDAETRQRGYPPSVSYTHLTLPTNREV